jgi:hypothetical protein
MNVFDIAELDFAVGVVAAVPAVLITTSFHFVCFCVEPWPRVVNHNKTSHIR